MDTQEIDKQIVELYDQGLTYKEIQEKLDVCSARVAKNVKGRRSLSESSQLCIKRGRRRLSEDGRKRLSEAGKKAAKRNRKFWTKPERKFKEILNSLGIGVKFPDYVKEICSLVDDPNPRICFQYPIQRYVCDYVDVESKIVFRVNGDFWHANPILYNESNLTDIQKHNLRQDKNAMIFLKKRGWEVCDVWESEIYWNITLVKEKIINIYGPLAKLAIASVLHTGDSQFKSGEAHLENDWSHKLKKLWFKKPRKPKVKEKECLHCEKLFKPKQNRIRYCSKECADLSRRKVERPTKKQLQREIKEMSWLALGRKYNVTDSAVRKWARNYGLIE